MRCHVGKVCEELREEDIVMSLMIQRGREMIRINTQKNTIEYSTSNGLNWNTRYSSGSCGTFYDLFDNGREILACTSKGVYYSTSEGLNWNCRYSSGACGTFMQLSSDGRYLYATTSQGLYYSSSNGLNWNKRS